MKRYFHFSKICSKVKIGEDTMPAIMHEMFEEKSDMKIVLFERVNGEFEINRSKNFIQ